MLKALKYLHSAGVISRDIKPSNILLNSDCSVKLCDFGLARSLVPSSNRDGNVLMTDYTATRWYRAPEILLGSPSYGFPVDLFAVGCVLGELLQGKPLFAGSSTLNQVEKLLELLGSPDERDIQAINSPYAKTILETIKIGGPVNADKTPLQHLTNKLRMKICDAPAEGVDLLAHLLLFNPLKRISAENALRHPFLKQFHDSREESVYPEPPIRIALDDNVKLTVDDYRTHIYESIRQKRRESNK